MSRGGRGGFQGGYSALGARFGIEGGGEGIEDQKPWETFPPHPLPTADPPTYAERRALHHHRTLRARIRDGNLYSLLDPSLRSRARTTRRSFSPIRARQTTPPTAHFNAFDGQETYTQKFRRKHAALPDLKSRPFAKEYFPQELWKTMGVGEEEEGRERKRLKISGVRFDAWMKKSRDEEGEGGEEEEDVPEEDDQEEKRKEKVDGDGSEVGDGEEKIDSDQFESDSEGDDYNAEQYFEGGEEDDYGDDDGGDGGREEE